MEFDEIIYEKKDGVAKVIINRPSLYNAFTATTLEEMYQAFRDSWADKSVGVVVLTGKGDRAFCTGGDQKIKDDSGYGKGKAKFELLDAHGQVISIIRAIPKPVIAAVNGFAIGGGHVLQVVCDLSIASETARFGQAGPKVGSFDAGFGTVFLARIVGEKKAREIWYMCRQYSAQEALEMGLVNKVVPADELESEVDKWCQEILEKAPYSLAYLKASFNADTDHVYGIGKMAAHAVDLYYGTDESHEGVQAFLEKRPPEFSRFRK
ncbi:MAG: 1,4-dihydroxy-2-naphthoyl-CoA synthase [Thermodesulfobacteriota bacterium]|jgi:naphthoate synthase|nr:1,4-dihydroxy-2-naphthoyl-CoA synthase [Thermodesulfobacteriota bacterium]